MRDIERELTPAMQKYQIGLLPYFPLASGLLTSKYRLGAEIPKDSRFAAWPRLADRYLNETNWKIVERLERFCARTGRSLLELAFSWLACKPVVASVIAGATKPEQVEQNVKAVNWKLSAEEMAEVNRITTKQGC